MPSSRRSVSNLGDVQVALNDIFNQLDNLTSKAQTFNGRLLTGIADANSGTDAVNYETMQSYVAAQVAILKALIPAKVASQPLNATNVTFDKNLVPKVTLTNSIGSSVIAWLKGWFGALNISTLSISQPVKSDGSKNLVSGAIILSGTDVNGTLPIGKGGTGETTFAAHGVLLGNSTTGINVASPSTSGFVLTDNGSSADPSFKVLPSSGWSGFSVQNIVTGSRSLATPVHNTGTTPILVRVTAHKTGGGTLQALVDGTISPSTVCAESTISTSDTISVNFVVIPGDYYQITFSGATIDLWTEWI